MTQDFSRVTVKSLIIQKKTLHLLTEPKFKRHSKSHRMLTAFQTFDRVLLHRWVSKLKTLVRHTNRSQKCLTPLFHFHPHAHAAHTTQRAHTCLNRDCFSKQTKQVFLQEHGQASPGQCSKCPLP